MRLIDDICAVIVWLVGISISALNVDPKEQDFLSLYVHEDE